jgi:plastocyanin
MPMSRWFWSDFWKLFLPAWTVLVLSNPFLEAMGRFASLSEKARVEGVVTYDGMLPKPIPVGEAATFRHLIEIDPKTSGLKDAVVWLEGVREPVAPDQKVADQPVIMDQQNFFFVPHVLAVKAGRAVEFRNSDVANHGVTASSQEPRNQFNVMIPHSGRFTHHFVTSKHPVAIGCPIHVSMAGWIFVFDHRFHAVTDSLGRFTLPPVPAGRYTLRVHHPDGVLRKSRQIALEADKPLHLVIDFHDRDRTVAK